MNDSENEKKTLRQSFKEKEYRHGYVDEFLNAYIATQIKVLREQHGWSQMELAEHAGMMQPRISVMENVNYASWSIKILRKIAEAFDLTLCVSFESFGRRIEDIEKFGREALERNSFDNDPYFKEESIDNSGLKFLADHYSENTQFVDSTGAGVTFVNASGSPVTWRSGLGIQPHKQSNVVTQMAPYLQRKQYRVKNEISEDSNEAAVG